MSPVSIARRYADQLLAVAVGLLFVTETLLWPTARLPAAALAAAVASAALAWRRRAAVPAFAVAAAASWAALRLAPGIDDDSLALLVLLFVSLYSLGRWTRGRTSWWAAACVLGYIVFFLASDAAANDRTTVDAGDVGFATLFIGTPWAAGVGIRLRRERERQLVVEGAEAVAQERARIARELHDVVAHAISVTVVQARGARAQLGRDETEVRRALDAIEQTNTAALGDMRRLLAALRDTEDDAGRAAPQPTLADLDRLVAQVRATGLQVEAEVTGRSDGVPPGVDLSAYRIVQEALTNVLKHAGAGARAQVRVAYGDGEVEVTVSDDGTGDGASYDNGGGHGLVGIRERVAVVGGRVDVRPGDHGGFVVSALLPYAWEGLT